MKNILLPTDFSENAYNALEYAVQLFENEDCIFHLLNTYTPVVYDIPPFADGNATLMLEEITRKNSENGLNEVEKKLKEKFNNPKQVFEQHSALNLFVSEVKALVKERKIDLIVMGTKGATGAKEIFLGTNTMHTIKNVNCAVIAVPESFSLEKPQEILFPTDFRFSLKNKYFPLLRSLCTYNMARLNILNIYYGEPLVPAQEKMKDALDSYFKNNAHLFHITENLDVIEAVDEFQIRHKINFLVMVQNKHSFFENILFKPVIKQLVFHTNVPFMVIPSQERLKD
ncbi:MAG TPA: universal stress protein [Aequorivita sp.]|nr:universal stress protein [Aequorivita sp.]